MKRMRIATSTGAVVIAAVLFAGPVAIAQQPEGAPGIVFGVKAANFGKTTLEDGQFSYSLIGGSAVEDAIVLINYSDEPIVVRLYPSDLIEAQGGGFAPAQHGGRMEGVGAWLELNDRELETIGIPARDRRTVPFTLKVPTGTPPGDYPGAIVASLDVGKAANGLSVQTRTALMVRLNVPGEIDLGVDVGELRTARASGGYRFDVEVRNTGNVLFTLSGSVDLLRAGKVIGRVPLSPSGIFVIPGGRAALNGVWKRPPAFGRVVTTAQVVTAVSQKPAGTFKSRPVTLTLLPLLRAGVGLAILSLASSLLIVTGGRRRARKARRREERELLRSHRERKADAARSRPRKPEDLSSVPEPQARTDGNDDYWRGQQLRQSTRGGR